MTREEIREGIAGRYCYRSYGSLLSYMVGQFGEDDYRVKVSYKYADDEMSTLHKQGVVIKVDRELPENPYPELARGWFGSDFEANITYYGKKDGYEEALKDMAGYSAFEPLIEDGHNDN